MDFSLPPVGEGLIEVELVRWLVRPGDAVTRGQPLMEVMSDKATMEVPAPFAGVIQSTVADAGSKLQVGQHILAYAGDGEPMNPSLLTGEKGEGRESLNNRPSLPLSHRERETNGTLRPSAAPSVRHGRGHAGC